MEIALSTVEDVDDAVEGAVIESICLGIDGGIRIYLEDGRSLLIPEAEILAVIPRGDTH